MSREGRAVELPLQETETEFCLKKWHLPEFRRQSFCFYIYLNSRRRLFKGTPDDNGVSITVTMSFICNASAAFQGSSYLSPSNKFLCLNFFTSSVSFFNFGMTKPLNFGRPFSMPTLISSVLVVYRILRHIFRI